MRLDRSWTPALVVAFVAFLSGGWLLQTSGGQDETDGYRAERLFQQVQRLVADRYVEEIGSGELYRMAIDGMLRELGDPHTTFLDPQEYEELELSTTGNYGGLGIRIDAQDGWITVVDVLPGTPAEQVGLQVGDQIVEVEGESAEGWSTTDAVKVLRGPEGSEVHITVARVGADRPLGFSVERAEIHVDPVHAFLMDGDVGFVDLRSFSRDADAELTSAVDSLRKAGARSIMLDLRYNPGGLLEQGVAVSNLFLGKGEQVVATRSRLEGQNETFSAPDAARFPDLPLAVLVNGYSASASEIVAGALQDHDRAVVVGTRTFGKGSVQTLFGLPGGNYLKMTTARWYTPSGRSIQKPRDAESRVESLLARAVTVSGEPVASGAADTAERETYHTESGRVVYGGGGITPDLIIMPDTLTTREQRLRTSLIQQGVSLEQASFRFSVRWVNEHPDVPLDFQVGSEIRRAFLDFLTSETGATVDRELFDAAERWIDWQLGRQIASAAYGETERIRRSVLQSPQVATAADLLRRAKDGRELIALAKERQARQGTGGEEENGGT